MKNESSDDLFGSEPKKQIKTNKEQVQSLQDSENKQIFCHNLHNSKIDVLTLNNLKYKQINNLRKVEQFDIHCPKPLKIQPQSQINNTPSSEESCIPKIASSFKKSSETRTTSSIQQGFRLYRKKQENDEEPIQNIKVEIGKGLQLQLSSSELLKIQRMFFEQQFNQQFQDCNANQRPSISDRHKEKNYNKNFIKSIGAKIILYIKDNITQYTKAHNIKDHDNQTHLDFLDREKKVSVQFFKSIMNPQTEESEQIKLIKKINRSLGFRYLKQYAQKDIFRNNKVIPENQGAYLLHCKLLERKLSNPDELDYLC